MTLVAHTDVGSASSISRKTLLLRKQIQLLARLVGKLKSHLRTEMATREKHLATALAPYLMIVADSAESLILLIENNHVRDAYVTGRTIFLSTMNACFTCVVGTGAVDRAFRHRLQKVFRDQTRKIKVGDLEFEFAVSADVSQHERDTDIASAVREFTTRKGREVRAWTQENFIQQLEKIEAKYDGPVGAMLRTAFEVIYRLASDIAHGTIYGLTLSEGLNKPKILSSRDETEYNRRFYTDILLYAVCLCICASVAVTANEFKDCWPFEVKSKEVKQELNSWFQHQEELSNRHREKR